MTSYSQYFVIFSLTVYSVLCNQHPEVEMCTTQTWDFNEIHSVIIRYTIPNNQTRNGSLFTTCQTYLKHSSYKNATSNSSDTLDKRHYRGHIEFISPPTREHDVLFLRTCYLSEECLNFAAELGQAIEINNSGQISYTFINYKDSTAINGYFVIKFVGKVNLTVESFEFLQLEKTSTSISNSTDIDKKPKINRSLLALSALPVILCFICVLVTAIQRGGKRFRQHCVIAKNERANPAYVSDETRSDKSHQTTKISTSKTDKTDLRVTFDIQLPHDKEPFAADGTFKYHRV